MKIAFGTTQREAESSTLIGRRADYAYSMSAGRELRDNASSSLSHWKCGSDPKTETKLHTQPRPTDTAPRPVQIPSLSNSQYSVRAYFLPDYKDVRQIETHIKLAISSIQSLS